MQERLRVRTVTALAVVRRRPFLGSVGYQRLAACGLHPNQAASYGPCRSTTLNRGQEGVVATGIQNHQTETRSPAHRTQRQVQRYGFELHVLVAFQARVHWYQKVPLVHLDTVSGVEHNGNVGFRRGARELLQALLQVRLPRVIDLHHLESKATQRGGNVVCIIGRVAQRRRMDVGSIADHQRHPLGRHRRDRQKQQQTCRTCRHCQQGRELPHTHGSTSFLCSTAIQQWRWPPTRARRSLSTNQRFSAKARNLLPPR